MTKNEASERYCIPPEVLQEYERLGLCGAVRKVMGAWQYDDRDIERLSLILTLHEIGFTPEEVETYLRLLLEGSATEEVQMELLDRKRAAALDDLHLRQRQLDRLDDLRYKLKRARERK